MKTLKEKRKELKSIAWGSIADLLKVIEKQDAQAVKDLKEEMNNEVRKDMLNLKINKIFGKFNHSSQEQKEASDVHGDAGNLNDEMLFGSTPNEDKESSDDGVASVHEVLEDGSDNHSPLSVAKTLNSNQKPKIEKDKEPEDVKSSPRNPSTKLASGSDNQICKKCQKHQGDGK